MCAGNKIHAYAELLSGTTQGTLIGQRATAAAGCAAVSVMPGRSSADPEARRRYSLADRLIKFYIHVYQN